uniref:Uncharacterized protein n=1 Tax=Physcomitrium patens TaxID=3218 RepID=A0A2K1J375_PHYPA|nr:hypothetical protein PHYPA_021824 [Physcomitrium patens]
MFKDKLSWRSLVFCKSSSHNCGLTQACSCKSEAVTSLARDLNVSAQR